MNKKNISDFIKLVKFDAQGLVPAIIQDYRDNAVLMLGYMSRESLAKTLLNGKACFWSRSRKKLWLKGEQSGNFQIVKSAYIDCDGDCLLFRVRQVHDAACHTGYRSCFFRGASRRGTLRLTGAKIFDPKEIYR
jgi:phosphoribosyl-AMP cyclohydrolase